MDRRTMLIQSGQILAGAGLAPFAAGSTCIDEIRANPDVMNNTSDITLFLCGDVMTGRGIDQILSHSVDPVLREPYASDARLYVRLAEKANGPIPQDVSPDYVWGDALEILDAARPDARIVNLETSVTTSDDYWPGKQIHYRMHPGNVAVLTAAGLDVCILGNNHVLDFSRAGLVETLEKLTTAGLRVVGAGRDAERASQPAVVEAKSGRILVFSYGSQCSGIPRKWQAHEKLPGLNLLPDLGQRGAESVIHDVEQHRLPGDRVVVSIHWGGNWGYRIPASQKELARRVIDAGAADVVHGHSSHHPKGIEVYENRLILYGCGDLLNDYEGISGKQRFRGELGLMYFARLDESGALVSLDLSPMRVVRFRLARAGREEVAWLSGTLDRECRDLGTRVELQSQSRLALRWD